jgi:hypothetical protein
MLSEASHIPSTACPESLTVVSFLSRPVAAVTAQEHKPAAEIPPVRRLLPNISTRYSLDSVSMEVTFFMTPPSMFTPRQQAHCRKKAGILKA